MAPTIAGSSWSNAGRDAPVALTIAPSLARTAPSSAATLLPCKGPVAGGSNGDFLYPHTPSPSSCQVVPSIAATRVLYEGLVAYRGIGGVRRYRAEDKG